MDDTEPVEDGEETARLVENVEENKEKSWKEVMLCLVILAALFLTSSTDSFIYPFFPQEAKAKGLTYIGIGLVFSAFDFSKFLTALAVGYLINWLNLRTWCLIGGTLSALSCISFGLATYTPTRTYLPLCLVIRLVAGMGSSVQAVAGTSALLKATSFETSTVAGFIESVIGVAYAIGPSLGSAFYELSGYTSMFWIIGGLTALVTLIQAVIVPRIEEEPTTEKSSLYLLKNPGILIIYLHYVILRAASAYLATNGGNFMREAFNKSSSIVGIVYAMWGIAYILSCPVATTLGNKGYLFSSILFAWAAEIVLLMFLCPSPILDFIFHGKRYFPLTVVSLGVLGATQGFLVIPPVQASINLATINGHKENSVQTYGAVMGLVTSSCGLGGMVGPILSGVITQTLDFTWTTTIVAFMGVIMLTLLIIYLLVMKITKQPLTPQEATNSQDNTDPTDSVNRIAEKLQQHFTESMKLGTNLEVVQPKKNMYG